MTRPSDGPLTTIEPPPAHPHDDVAAVNAMFEQNIKLAYSALQRVTALWAHMTHDRYEELTQAALFAHWRACRDFDPSRGVALSTVVFRYVRNAVLVTSRQWTTKPGGITQYPTQHDAHIASIDAHNDDRGRDGSRSIGERIPDHRHDDPAQIAEERDLAEERARIARRMIETCTNLCPGERTALNAALDGLDRGQMTELMGTTWHSARTAYGNGLAKLRGQVRTIDNGRPRA